MGEESTDPHRVLARNAACHQCRKRKLKCDALRPTCGNCQKPRQRGPIKYEPPEPCTWDEVRDPSARTLRKRENKAAMQRRQQEAGGSGIVTSGLSAGPPLTSPTLMENGVAIKRARVDNDGGDLPFHINPEQLSMHSGSTNNDVQQTGDAALPEAWFSTAPNLVNKWVSSVPTLLAQPPRDAPAPETTGAHGHQHRNSVTSVTGLELVWPDWPVDLPSQDVVEHVMHVFWDRVPTLPKMFHRATLFSNLQLPPSHPKFPATSLLHAILAVTASYLSPDAIASRAYFPVGASSTDIHHPNFDFTQGTSGLHPAFSFSSNTNASDESPLNRFQMWHRRKSFEAMCQHVKTGQKVLQGIQAFTLVLWVDVMNAWWTDLWMESGQAVRIAVPMNLNVSSNVHCNSLLRNPMDLAGPAQSAIEQAERDRTWWMIYMTERVSISGTAWPSAIDDGEITVELPIMQHIFDSGGDGMGSLTGVQNLHAPDLYSNHLPQHMESFSFLIKAIKLFTETNTFIRRYSRGEHTYARYLADPGLRKCLSDINTFRLSYPESMRRPIRQLPDGGEVIDGELFTSLTLTHSAVINLGEPLITYQTWSDDAAKMTLSAVRAMLSLIYDVNATTYDLTLLPASNSYHWCLAARCLLRFIAAARLSNDPVSAQVFEAEVQVFVFALKTFGERHPVGLRHLKLLDIIKETAMQQMTGLVASLSCTKDQVFDKEFSNEKPRKTATASSYASPSSYTSGLTPTATTATTNTGLATPLMPSNTTVPGTFSSPVNNSAVPALPTVGGPGPGGPVPGQLGLSGMGGLSPTSTMAPQAMNTTRTGPTAAAMPPSAPAPPVIPTAQQINQTALNSMAHFGVAAVSDVNVQMPSWMKGFDAFDIHSYAFDVEAMANYVSLTDPNATFNGADFVFPTA
ncbi:hypothetical protein Q8F55_004818 [Vanrija albida]|uniref:Zn(2)-C6 fungal-type domain-containing protein n=1 Tax=Vanrija albida TaxID=181172 RepID=A0ABR3PZZ5_9TREE